MTTTKPPVWFWIVSVLALLWNAGGVSQYLQQAYKVESFRANFTPEQLEMMDNTPAWVTAAFAIAVFSAFLACVGLLVRKKWAKPLFLLSLLAVIVQMGYTFFISDMKDAMKPAALGMTLSIIVIAVLLYWFAKHSASKKWIV